jgi:hypothetical protein
VEVCDKRKNEIVVNANMEFKNAYSNGDNVLASNLNNIKVFCFLEAVKIEVEKHTLYVFF